MQKIITLKMNFLRDVVSMPMKEIAAKIERKQLLDELELLKKLGCDGQEVVTSTSNIK